jgi:hypothetical protein
MNPSDENDNRVFLDGNPPTFKLPTHAEVLLLHRSGSHVKLRARQRSSRPDSEASFDETPLFMRSRRSRREQRSLSNLSNNSKASTKDSDILRFGSSTIGEDLAWKVINKEISEWQNVCQTGRPSWWSPSSRWTKRQKSLSNLQQAYHNVGSWQDELDENYHSSPQSDDDEKRAGTDNYDVKTLDKQDLAQVVAVQLLSACFTLPADQIASFKVTPHLLIDPVHSNILPDSRMISSLRMHTNYRWAPAFGNEARNPSPEYYQHFAHDISSQNTSPGQDLQTPEVESSGKARIKRHKHRVRHTTADPSADDSQRKKFLMHSDASFGSTLSTSWELRRGSHKEYLQRIDSFSKVPQRNVRSCPPSPFSSAEFLCSAYMFSTPPAQRIESDRKRRRNRRDDSRYSLQSVLRSEPHPIFIQPVRELVIKQWRTFRRRFKYTPNNVPPESMVPSPAFLTGYFTPTWSPIGGAHSNADAIRRRRDARQRHDIHSSSIESSPRYNTPTSGSPSDFSDAISTQQTPDEEKCGQLAEACSFAKTGPASQGSSIASQTPPMFTPNNSLQCTPPQTRPSMGPRTESVFFMPTTTSPGSPASSCSPRRGSRRAQRKSMLSEVCTAEDVLEEEPLHREFILALATTLATSKEESESDGSSRLAAFAAKHRKVITEQADHIAIELHMPTKCGSSPGSVPNIRDRLFHPPASLGTEDSSPEMPISAAPPESWLDDGSATGPLKEVDSQSRDSSRSRRLHRVSSSGTQIFTPDEEGVEVDGLPTGPPAIFWDDAVVGEGKGKLGEGGRSVRRSRSYL